MDNVARGLIVLIVLCAIPWHVLIVLAVLIALAEIALRIAAPRR